MRILINQYQCSKNTEYVPLFFILYVFFILYLNRQKEKKDLCDISNHIIYYTNIKVTSKEKTFADKSLSTSAVYSLNSL